MSSSVQEKSTESLTSLSLSTAFLSIRPSIVETAVLFFLIGIAVFKWVLGSSLEIPLDEVHVHDKVCKAWLLQA